MVHRRVRGRKWKVKYVEKQCPIEVGDELEVNITDITPSGDGMSRIQGYEIHVPNAKPRDRVAIRVNKVDDKTVKGDIIS